MHGRAHLNFLILIVFGHQVVPHDFLKHAQNCQCKTNSKIQNTVCVCVILIYICE
jgi:uncharacterized membrane protein YccF (DUF307 family)